MSDQKISVNLKRVSIDARGVIDVIEIDGQKVASIESFNAGAPRGGHYHAWRELKYVISGTLDYFSVNAAEQISDPFSSSYRRTVKPAELFYIEPGFAHLFIAKTNSALFSPRPATGYGAVDYEPYRKFVRDFLEGKK